MSHVGYGRNLLAAQRILYIGVEVVNWGVLRVVLDVLAVVISVVALIRTYALQRKHTELAERQLKLEEERRAEERERSTRARISCAFISGARRGSYFLELTNDGPAPATNVVLRFEGANPVVDSEMDKFPIADLPAGHFVRLVAAPHMGMPSLFNAIVTWTDPDGTEREERFPLTIP